MATPSADQITQLGFPAVGADVAISDHCSIYDAGRSASETINDFAILTARQPLAQAPEPRALHHERDENRLGLLRAARVHSQRGTRRER